jgi:hypothetical protein
MISAAISANVSEHYRTTTTDLTLVVYVLSYHFWFLSDDSGTKDLQY